MTVEIWQHNRSGERYAVQMDDTGFIAGAAGPLHHSSIAKVLSGDFDFDPEVTKDIIDYADSYHRVEQ